MSLGNFISKLIFIKTVKINLHENDSKLEDKLSTKIYLKMICYNFNPAINTSKIFLLLSHLLKFQPSFLLKKLPNIKTSWKSPMITRMPTILDSTVVNICVCTYTHTCVQICTHTHYTYIHIQNMSSKLDIFTPKYLARISKKNNILLI